MNRFFVVVFFILLSVNQSFAQSKSKLEKRRKQTQKEIRYVNNLLKENANNKKVSYNQLLITEKKIKLQQKLIEEILQQQKNLKKKIKKNTVTIENLEIELQKIKEEYAKILNFTYEHRNNNDLIMFIFSAKSFNQAYKRLQYIQQYSAYRKQQVAKIKSTQQTLNEKLKEFEEQNQEFDRLIADYNQENLSFISEKQKQANIIQRLKKQERKLKQQLRKHQKEKLKIQKAIARLIRLEAEKAQRANKKKVYDIYTPEQKLISKEFGKNKGRLPWPVKKGIITYKYGVHNHPVLKGVKEKKNGVGISTNKGALARSIFAGRVTNILPLTSKTFAVMIKHGAYITVYVNISEVLVSVGQNVKAKEDIGVIYTQPNGKNSTTTLELQIWKGNQLMNPIKWIAK